MVHSSTVTKLELNQRTSRSISSLVNGLPLFSCSDALLGYPCCFLRWRGGYCCCRLASWLVSLLFFPRLSGIWPLTYTTERCYLLYAPTVLQLSVDPLSLLVGLILFGPPCLRLLLVRLTITTIARCFGAFEAGCNCLSSSNDYSRYFT